jgi:hypothetical protein
MFSFPCSICRWLPRGGSIRHSRCLMFNPSQFCETSMFLHGSYSVVTMVSADFLMYRNTKPNSGYPPVRACSFGQFLAHLLPDVVGCKRWHVVLPYSHPIASYVLYVLQYRPLQSCLLHSCGYPQRVCSLLTGLYLS